MQRVRALSEEMEEVATRLKETLEPCKLAVQQKLPVQSCHFHKFSQWVSSQQVCPLHFIPLASGSCHRMIWCYPPLIPLSTDRVVRSLNISVCCR